MNKKMILTVLCCLAAALVLPACGGKATGTAAATVQDTVKESFADETKAADESKTAAETTAEETTFAETSAAENTAAETSAAEIVTAETASFTTAVSEITGAETTAAEESAAAASPAAENVSAASVLNYNGVELYVGMPAEEAMTALGEPSGSRDVNNCANGYVNKAYTYGPDKDIEVYVVQNEAGAEIVSNITLLTGNVSTAEGLKPGDAESAVLTVYPDAEKGLGSYKVKGNGTQLYIKMADGAVSYISYEYE